MKHPAFTQRGCDVGSLPCLSEVNGWLHGSNPWHIGHNKTIYCCSKSRLQFQGYDKLIFGNNWIREHAKNFKPEDMQVQMEGKNCIVTGANSGIGFATAEGLASRCLSYLKFFFLRELAVWDQFKNYTLFQVSLTAMSFECFKWGNRLHGMP